MIAFSIISCLISLTISLVIGQEFCSDSSALKEIFFTSNQNYLEKNYRFYRRLTNTSFAGSLSQEHKTYFRVVFQSIQTGFAITRIPDCNSGTNYCTELKKVLNMSFVIGLRAQFNEQTYVTYRYDSVAGLVLITDTQEMPFGMKMESEIGGGFWPFSASKDVRYRHSAFSEKEFQILLLIYEKQSQNEKLYWTFLTKDNWEKNWSSALPTYSGVTGILEFFGFFQFHSNIYSIADYSKTDLIVVKHKSNETFIPENALKLDEDIYGCKISSTESISETTTQNTESQSQKSPDIEHSVTSSTITTTTTTAHIPLSKSEGSNVLVWLIVTIIIIGSILLIAGVIFFGFRKSSKGQNKNKVIKKVESKNANNESNS